MLFRSGGPAIIDVIAGQCDFLIANVGPLLGHVRGGKLVPLAVTGKTRAAVLPNVPTIAESGLPGYESATWYGFLGPAAISKDVVARVNSVAGTALKNQDTRERFVALGAEPVTNTPEQFATFLKKDMQDWAKVVKISGARLD